MLAVRDGNAAIAFYQAAFAAEVLWHLDGGRHVVAGLLIDGAKFFLAQESPQYGTRDPSSVGFTTVRSMTQWRCTNVRSMREQLNTALWKNMCTR